MKARLNLTIDEDLLDRIKRYAEIKQVSVSELVEIYFRRIGKRRTRRSIVDLVEKLPKHTIPSGQDLKKEFYEDQADKYGFQDIS